MRYIFRIIIFTCLFTSCSNDHNDGKSTETGNDQARGFVISKSGPNDEVTRLTVFNPWEKAKGIEFNYFLINREKEVADSLIGRQVIRTPVRKVVCLSTTHLAFLDVLDETEAVVGISGKQYISNPDIKRQMEQGKIPDVGYGQNLNYELMVQLKPELVLVYGIGSEVTGYTRKLEELGIPVLMVGEYLEESPLGKAEWIKFLGALFEKEGHATAYYTKVEREYNRLKEMVEEITYRPGVLVGSPYNDAWWVPGGNSYFANLIADAGGNYSGKNNPSHESYIISFENALAWGGQADIWINMSSFTSRHEILAADERFRSLRVFNEGRVYNNVKRVSASGGNDFWESGTVNPHLVLRDLIQIFHPGLIEAELVYYEEIK